MSQRVQFALEASAELEDAARWYEQRHAGLGFSFLAAVDLAVEALARWPLLHGFDGDPLGVSSECFEVTAIGGDYDPVRLGQRDHDGVHCRASPGSCSELACAPSDSFGQHRVDVAAFEEPVDVGVGSRPARH